MTHVLFSANKCACVEIGIALLALTPFFVRFEILFYMEVSKPKCIYSGCMTLPRNVEGKDLKQNLCVGA